MVTTMSHQQILAVSELSHVSILRVFLSCVICAEVESQKSLDKNNSADAGMRADAFTSLRHLSVTAHTPSSSPRPDPGDSNSRLTICLLLFNSDVILQR